MERATPPNGYGCKCYTVAITKERKERYENKGIPTATIDGESILIKPITTAPKTTYKTYYNERKRIVEKVPNGVHPTFNFNPAVATRDLPIFDAFMKKGKANFPTCYEKIAESILTSQVKEEQFTSWVEDVFKYTKDKETKGAIQPHSMTGIGFIDTKVANFLKAKGVDIGESVASACLWQLLGLRLVY